MADITLSQSSSSLRTLQATTDLLTRSRERLAERSSTRTGNEPQSPTVTAAGLVSRANDLTQLSEAISDAAETVQAATDGISQIIELVESAQQSLADDDSTDSTSLADILKQLIEQINEVVNGSGVNGVNLLDGDSLSVSFNTEGTSKLDIEGADDTASGLGIEAADADGEDSVSSLLEKLAAALEALQGQLASLGNTLSQVETRQDFALSMIATLQAGASSLAIADTDEEGANLLALQTRQLLSSTNQSLTAEADQSVLRLF